MKAEVSRMPEELSTPGVPVSHARLQPAEKPHWHVTSSTFDIVMVKGGCISSPRGETGATQLTAIEGRFISIVLLLREDLHGERVLGLDGLVAKWRRHRATGTALHPERC